MLDVLPLIESRLHPRLVRAGFDAAQTDTFELQEGDVIQLLEYRCQTDRQEVLMLDICVMVNLQTVTAEIWCPSDLTDERVRTTVGTIARYRRVWRYNQETDVYVLADQLVSDVSHWLERATSTRVQC